MKICKNCATVNTSAATSCVKCSMKGMMIEMPNSSKAQPAIKKIYHSCRNCGTADTGSDTKCKKCNFPILSDITAAPTHPIANIENIAS